MSMMSRADAEEFEDIKGRRPSLVERGVVLSTRTKGIADWQNTKQFASLSANEQEWVALFDRRPDVLHQLLGDIYIAVKYDDRKRETGERLDGRRVMPKDANLAELYAMITPRYSTEPFGVAVKELIGDRPLRTFAALVPMDHRQLSRMMRGQARLETYWLERIAAAGRVTPAYFVEWRVEFIHQRLLRVFEQRPNLSIGVVKRFSDLPARMRTLVGSTG